MNPITGQYIDVNNEGFTTLGSGLDNKPVTVWGGPPPIVPVSGNPVTTYPFYLNLLDNRYVLQPTPPGGNPLCVLNDGNSSNSGSPIWVNTCFSFSPPTQGELTKQLDSVTNLPITDGRSMYCQFAIEAFASSTGVQITPSFPSYNVPSLSNCEFEVSVYDVTAAPISVPAFKTLMMGHNLPSIQYTTLTPTLPATAANLILNPNNKYVVVARKASSSIGNNVNVFITKVSMLVHLQ